MICHETDCTRYATYYQYCPIHVHGPIDTNDYVEFFYEALCHTHLRGHKQLKHLWAKQLFDQLETFKDCLSFTNVYDLVKSIISGKNPQLFLYDTAAKICRKFNIPMLDVPEQAFTGGPKNWVDILKGSREPREIYYIMKKHLGREEREELDDYWCEIKNSPYIGDHFETLMCRFKPERPIIQTPKGGKIRVICKKIRV